MARPYRVVLIGCGPRGRRHAEGFQANADRFELTAVCDVDAARATALATDLGVARAGADADAVLAAERPDVLCFATPPAVRLSLVELGIRHGVRALAFEKPLALSLAEGRRIVERCRAAGVRAAVCHQLKHAAHWRRARELVAGGAVGRVETLHATARPSMLRAGTHVVDAMRWLNAESPAEWAIGQADGTAAYAEDHPCPDHVMGTVAFANGARGLLELGALAPHHRGPDDFWGDCAVAVHGSHGHVRVVLGGGWEAVTHGGAVESGPADLAPQEATHLRLLADWLDDAGRPHPDRVEAAYAGLEILFALGLSSLERRRVELPIEPPPADILERLRRALAAPGQGP